MLKRFSLFVLFVCITSAAVSAQIKLPIKIGQPKPTPAPVNPPVQPNLNNNSNNSSNSGQSSGSMQMPQANENPVFLKTTLDVRLDMENRYWKLPAESNYTSWIPQVRFKVFYKSNVRLRYMVEYTTPDGKPWFSETVDPSGADAAEQTVSISSGRGPNRFENISRIDTGTFGVKIINTRDNSVAFEGKFKVNKYKYGPNIPMFKNQNCFYVEQDWNLPIGYVWLDYKADKFSPLVKVSMWIKNEPRADDLEARLLYNGQEIATTDDMGEARTGQDRYPNIIENKELAYWQEWNFAWQKIRYKAGEGGYKYNQAKWINDMPGDYVVKIFHKGVQIREAKFSVAGGSLADNNIGRQNGFAEAKLFIPVKIMGTEKWNAMAWKTDAFYGNPLAGFNP